MKELSIIIVNYKSWNKLSMCLNSLLKQKEIRYEVIVVDNNSNDEKSGEDCSWESDYFRIVVVKLRRLDSHSEPRISLTPRRASSLSRRGRSSWSGAARRSSARSRASPTRSCSSSAQRRRSPSTRPSRTRCGAR